MYRALCDADLETIGSELKRLFANIAADNYRKNDIARYEGYYASVGYSFFAGMGCEVMAADAGNTEQIAIYWFRQD